MKPLIPWFEQPVLRIPLPDGLPFDEIPIHGFGVLVALGFMFGSRIAMDRAKRVGLDPDVINRLIGWLVIGTFVGGHVGYGLMYAPDEYLANPMLFLKVWDGLSSWGGFLACIPISIWFFKSEKVPVWPYLDCIAYGLTVGWFLGRMGCFVAHDHPGPETNFWLGVYGICQPPGHNGAPSIACHDMGLYEALWSLSMFGVFRVLDTKARVPGFYPLLLGAAYGPVRFVMDHFRPEVTDARYAGLTPAMWLSALFFVLCVGWLIQRSKSGDAPVWAPPGTTAEPKKAA